MLNSTGVYYVTTMEEFVICNVLKEGHIDFFPERKAKFHEFKTKRLQTVCKDLQSHYDAILVQCKKKSKQKCAGSDEMGRASEKNIAQRGFRQ